jgi:hypothetical protein
MLPFSTTDSIAHKKIRFPFASANKTGLKTKSKTIFYLLGLPFPPPLEEDDEERELEEEGALDLCVLLLGLLLCTLGELLSTL